MGQSHSRAGQGGAAVTFQGRFPALECGNGVAQAPVGFSRAGICTLTILGSLPAEDFPSFDDFLLLGVRERPVSPPEDPRASPELWIPSQGWNSTGQATARGHGVGGTAVCVSSPARSK